MAYSEDFMRQSTCLIGSIAEILMPRHWIMGTAESCTGGLVAALCTELPGSSAWFAGGMVTYSNSLKTSLLGVESGMLASHGAVSGPVAERMAVGALAALDVQASVGISGIAGPDGGSPGKQVGTVWIGVAVRAPEEGEARGLIRHFLFTGNRGEVRASACFEALTMLLEILQARP